MGVRQPASLKMSSGDNSSTFMKASKQLMVVRVCVPIPAKLTLHCSLMSQHSQIMNHRWKIVEDHIQYDFVDDRMRMNKNFLKCRKEKKKAAFCTMLKLNLF